MRKNFDLNVSIINFLKTSVDVVVVQISRVIIILEMMDDGLNDLLSEAVNEYQKEEGVLDDGLDNILSQSLDMFEEQSEEARI